MSQGSLLPLERAGEVVRCLRCGVPCRVAPVKDTEARPFQAADGNGQCPACIVADLLQAELEIGWILPPEADIKEVLRMPHIQEQLKRMMVVGHSQMDFESIDWEAVIANWDLPLIKKRGRKRNGKR